MYYHPDPRDPDYDGFSCNGECNTCDMLEECKAYPEYRTTQCARCHTWVPTEWGFLHDEYDGEYVCNDCFIDLHGVKNKTLDKRS